MELRPIDRIDRAKTRLSEALDIYKELMLPEAQNPERQILYWIEHNKELVDEFKFFAVQHGSQVLGYLQYSFFREERIIFFEYLCIRDSRRRGLVPSEATKSIAAYLAENYPPNLTLVIEIVHKKNNHGQWVPDKKLLAYFARLGFRELHFDYRYPNLQSYEGEPSFPAKLMVLLPGGRTEISSSEMRTVLRCIYYKHYLRWDRPFLDAEKFTDRERLIDTLYFQEVEQIGRSNTFGTSGDDKRINKNPFAKHQPGVYRLLDRVFGPKLPRIIVVAVSLIIAAKLLPSTWLLIPFVFAVAIIYCLAEDTASSHKLLVVILSRFRFAGTLEEAKADGASDEPLDGR
jgi:hypothetical protein